MKKAVAIGLLAIAVLAGVWFFKTAERRYPWLWAYVYDQLHPVKETAVTGPKHIMFLYVDHFEPHDPETVERWMKTYPVMAGKHRDSDGKVPQHTWFWYFSQSEDPEKESFLTELAALAYEGFGEVELHLHHWADTEETLIQKINHALKLSAQTGALVTAEPKPRTAFAFIHGLWGLDNSRGPGACGVNNELIVLRRLGCYADFTNPSWGRMHPRMVNRLYYATDDPEQPKSYDTGIPMKVGQPGIGDLLMFTGQSVVTLAGIKPRYDHGEISAEELPTRDRVDRWIKQGVRIEGKPDWIFLKVFSHGAIAEDHEAVLGKWSDDMYTHLEQTYNDGTRYQLHYVTAREAVNIAKAAEAGKTGNPNEYRDFLIPSYVSRLMSVSVPYEAISVEHEKAVIKLLSHPGEPVVIRLRAGDVSVSGDAAGVTVNQTQNETVIHLTTSGGGIIGFSFKGLKP